MENNRYNFGGFTFGENGLAVLRIEVLNQNQKGTRYSTEICLELTADERVELIKKIISLDEKEVR